MSTQDFSPKSLRAALASLFSRPEVRLVILFGSRSRSEGGPGSDLDLAILADQPLDTFAMTNFLIRQLGFSSVDVTDLRGCSPTLAVAAAEGTLLYERSPGDFAAFHSLSLRKFWDHRKFREAERRHIHRFLERRGLHVAD